MQMTCHRQLFYTYLYIKKLPQINLQQLLVYKWSGIKRQPLRSQPAYHDCPEWYRK
jgi:hypothetical protein